VAETRSDSHLPPSPTVPPAQNPEAEAGPSTCWSRLRGWLLGLWNTLASFFNYGSS
jgi:hypothetical protein